MHYVTMASIIVLSFGLTASICFAKSPSLIGSWHGGGIVQPKSGEKEKTRCRATIEKAPARGQYQAKYRCSSPYGIVEQDITLNKTGNNRYKGAFHNPRHKLGGFISIILQGNNQTVKMNSPDGEGWFDLQRR